MKFLKIYFYLFLASILVSQSLMDLFSTLFCLQWVWIWWQNKKTGIKTPFLHSMGLEKVFIAWWVICAVGFALTWIDPEYALIRLIEFKWILIFYVMIEILDVVKPSVRSFNFLFGIFLVNALLNLLLYVADFEVLKPLRYGAGEFLRAGGLFADPMTFAHSFSLLFCLVMGIGLVNFTALKNQQRVFVFLSLVLGLVGLILTFTRGVWLGVLFGVFSMLMVWRPKIAVLSIVLLLGVGFAAYQGSDVFHWRISQTMQEAEGASERKLLWQAHFLEFKENPIFGLGYGQNGKLLPLAYAKLGFPAETLVSHAHNQYLHLAAGTGTLGLMCYLFIWFFFFRILFQLWKNPNLSRYDRGVVLGLLMAQTSFLVAGMTEANFEHSKVRFMVMLLWAYAIYLSKAYRMKENT